MLLLFESASGFHIFKVNDEDKLNKPDSLYKEFESAKKAAKLLSFEQTQKFKDASDAVQSVTALIEGKLSKRLKKFLSKKILPSYSDETLAVADAKLATAIKEKFQIPCVTSNAVQELMSCIRIHLPELIPDWDENEEAAMQLGLSHGLGRYKLKFSPDKVDIMIIQAISLLDDLDKELNNYIMRAKEWYGWHFPELMKIIPDNIAYIKTVLALGMRTNASKVDLSEIVPEDVEVQIKTLAEVSMGTEIADEDLLNIHTLCQNCIDLHEYRQQLLEYLKNRMMAVAPNLTILVGELVGARLISRAGSLLNLAKHPASTVQILGAEKALFRALKTKHDTPKYGLIYHAQLITQANSKIKGKMSRMLAAKAALAIRVDALGEESTNDLGLQNRAKLETQLKFLEEGKIRRVSGGPGKQYQPKKYDHKSKIMVYKDGADSTYVPLNKRKTFDSLGDSQKVEIKTEDEKDNVVPKREFEEDEEVKPKMKKKKIKHEPDA
ncbi:Nucleolar protein 58 [Sarcoptes scabiei]|uniref:Nucleolar protein 58 n=1 Tax=Sarcoptes scabiei TaxID=52283 RepID=A0A834R879_SARSC|nr:Nucleolar protein 58 [Sarcoptes scabiei]